MTVPPGVSLVPMTAAHVAAVMPYETAMFGTEAWTVNGYLSEIADTARRVYRVALQDGELVGWAGVLVIADSAEVLTVGVIPVARRRGIARTLVDALLDEARRRGSVEAFLEVRVDNPGARALYAIQGFVEVGVRPGYYDAGRVDAVVMRRVL